MKIDIVRAWKDEDYRSSLSDAQRAQLPANPAGLVELSETDLLGVAGGTFTDLVVCSYITACPSINYCPSQITVCFSINYCPLDYLD